MPKYSPVGQAEETYAAGFICHTCRGSFFGGVTHDPAQPNAYPLLFRFCPCCGVAFSGVNLPSEETERRLDLRGQAGWKNHYAAEARKITYTLQNNVTGQWTDDWAYSSMTTRQAVVFSWRERLARGSWCGEDIRLVARTPRGEKVVFGPVHIKRGPSDES